MKLAGSKACHSPAMIGRPLLGHSSCCPSRRFAVASSQAAGTPVELPPLLDVDGDFPARHAFSEYANWVVPGYIMIGEYPFINGTTCNSHDAGEARLSQILQAGVTAFASTLGELPSQQELPIGGRDGFIPYKPTADLIAAGLSGPPPSEVVEGLRNPYLDKFIPARKREASEAYRAYKPIIPKYISVPIDPDTSKNSADGVAAEVEVLKDNVKGGDKLYVHCSGGTGRSAVIAACLLVSLYSIDPDEAMARLKLARNLRGDAPEGKIIESPSTSEQADFVREVCKRYT